jgi:hypothetical protein
LWRSLPDLPPAFSSLLWAAVGALTFYVSEYGFHRFGFHAEPSRFAFVRKLQHRLH